MSDYAERPLQPPRGCGKKHHTKAGSGYSENMVMLATSLATQLARGRSECELETLINVVDLLQDVLIAILAQRRICDLKPAMNKSLLNYQI